MQPSLEIINTTKNWIEKIVIGLNFCPFASHPFKSDTIHYEVIFESDLNKILNAFSTACSQLSSVNEIETTLLILPGNFNDFEEYLDLVDLCEQLLKLEKLDIDFQVASFHPEYIFSDSEQNDAANYTNRSPFPMIHILREERLTMAIDKHINVDEIPENNIKIARALGVAYFESTGFFKS